MASFKKIALEIFVKVYDSGDHCEHMLLKRGETITNQ